MRLIYFDFQPETGRRHPRGLERLQHTWGGWPATQGRQGAAQRFKKKKIKYIKNTLIKYIKKKYFGL